jgi:hypothetical protein
MTYSKGKPSTNDSNAVMARKKLTFFKSFLMMELEILRAEQGTDNSRQSYTTSFTQAYPLSTSASVPEVRAHCRMGCGGGR